MNNNQNSNVKKDKDEEEKPQTSAANQPSSGSSGQGTSSSSGGTGTTVSSAETVPTQEASSLPEEFPDDTAWGVLYPIDRCFYPLDLRDDLYTFGRGQDCTYSFDVPSIKQTQHYKSYSKKHFTIKRTKSTSGGYSVLLIDSSMNGVFINGERVPERGSRQLRDKDEIAISTDKNRILLFFDKDREDDPNLPQSFKDKYIMHKVIGNGAFGEVREALSKSGIERYAVKIINKQKTIFSSKDAEKVNKDIMKEARLMLSLHHPCVIRVQDVIDSVQNLYIVLELANGGELFTRVLNKGMLSEPIAKLVFYQMASAVAYLHDNNVTHRDLKPENILMMSDEEECLIKITDFGVSRLVGETSFMKTQAGTPSYLAPELLKTFRSRTHQGYTKQVDSWSMGVILFVCLVGYPPFARDRKDTDQELVDQILKGNYNFNHQRWLNVSENGKDMIRNLLKMDAKERLTPKQALEHDWVKDSVMKSKADALMSQSAISTPSDNYSLINKIEQGEKETSFGLNLVMQNSEISSTSTKSVPAVSQEKRAEKRHLPSDTSSESEKSNGDTDSLHLKEKHFAGASSAEPNVPQLQKPHFDEK